MPSRTLLGFDFGRKRIGVAVGHELTATTQPVATIAMIQDKPDWIYISRIIEEWAPGLLIIGLPLNQDDSEHDTSRAARRFANQLNGRYNLPIEMIDERLTSSAAEEIIREQRRSKKMRRRASKSAIDQIAAELILKTWLHQ